MKSIHGLAVLLGLGTALCAPKEAGNAGGMACRPAPESAAKIPPQEKPVTQARWIEVAAVARKFLIVRIADEKHRPARDFVGANLLGIPGNALFYVLIPGGAGTTIGRVDEGKAKALDAPRLIFRMPGSALYTCFSAGAGSPVSLTFREGGREETVTLSAASLSALPFFWSGDPAYIAFDEVPGWMEHSGP